MASPNDVHSQELQPYIGEDTFDAFIDLDFLRNNHSSMDEDVDIGTMSNSDLFRYFLEGELVKAPDTIDTEQPPNSFPSPMQDVNDFTLMPNAVMNTEDMKISSMTPPTAVSPITPSADLVDLPQQNLANSTVVPSLAVLNAQLAELLAKLPLIKQEPTDNKISTATLLTSKTPSAITPKHNTTSSHNGESVTSPTSPDPNEILPSIDLKKLTSKERRQLRNKISARNFRVRRKEYISNLESTNQQQSEEINLLRQALLHIQEENSKLKEEVEELRKQQKQTSFVTSPPSPPHIPSKESSGVTLAALSKNNNGNNRPNSVKNSVTHPHQPPTSPANRYLVIPNVNKDTPASPSQSQKTWSDSRVRVQTTFIPEFNLDKHLFQDNFENKTFGHWQNSSPLTMFMGKDGQQMWLAYILVATLMQQMSALFVQAVCAIPHNEMIASLYPNNKPSTFDQLQSTSEVSTGELEPVASTVIIETTEDTQESTLSAPSPPPPTLDNTTLVEDASVLDWLYDTMVRHVVEQSQIEARMHELQSDWVGDELEDNVLPLLF